MLMEKEIYDELNSLSDEINQLYGFVEDTPCINYGPCGVFAYLFYHEWNTCIPDKVHICFVMMKDMSECYHVCICLPSGELYDGGIGVHTRKEYHDFVLEDMYEYDHQLLEKWSYGLERTYPRYCPNFDRERTRKIIHRHIKKIQNIYSVSFQKDNNV